MQRTGTKGLLPAVCCPYSTVGRDKSEYLADKTEYLGRGIHQKDDCPTKNNAYNNLIMRSKRDVGDRTGLTRIEKLTYILNTF